MRWRILDAFAEAAVMAGIPASADFNTGDNFGCGYFQVNQRAGRRWSAASGFLKPALGRPNLKVELNAHATRVIVRDGRAAGVAWTRDGQAFSAEASGEVVLAAGAVATPQLLELSGIGDGEHLRSLGIETLAHLPGVGANLQDHLQVRPHFEVAGAPTMNALYASWWRRPLMALEYAAWRKGPLTMAPSQLGAFAKSSDEHATPNLQFHVQPLSLDKFGSALHPYPPSQSASANLRPTSRGLDPRPFAGRRRGPADPAQLPVDARRTSAWPSTRLRLTRRIMDQPPMRQYAPRERKPGGEAQTDTELLQAARDLGTTIFHPVGTAKMGLASDPLAVSTPSCECAASRACAWPTLGHAEIVSG
jgi:choline dehydrogenase-like flavoprotein